MTATASDLERNLRLHLPGAELTAEQRRLALGAIATRRWPPAPLRGAQRVAMKLGALDWQRHWLAPLLRLRRAVLGEAAQGPPRFLVRVDEFPYYAAFDDPRYGLEASRRFHAIMADNGVAHLMSTVPQLTHRPLDPAGEGGRPLEDAEIALIEEMGRTGVSFAQHGTTHRTRFESPRRRSELGGLDDDELRELLERGRLALAAIGVRPRAFVPPFNRFDAGQYAVLAERFDIVCGGPESVPLLGFQGGPLWRGEAVYLPCYLPLYATATAIVPVVEALIEAQVGTWIPIVLHTGWEVDDELRGLPRLAARIGPYAEHWDDFLAAVDASAS